MEGFRDFLRNISAFPQNVIFIILMTVFYLVIRYMIYERRESIVVDFIIFAMIHTLFQIFDYITPRTQLDPHLSIPFAASAKLFVLGFLLALSAFIHRRL